MEITREQRAAWAANEENKEWEAIVGPQYKNADGTADLNRLYKLAELNGLTGLKDRYDGNPGQIAMKREKSIKAPLEARCAQAPIAGAGMAFSGVAVELGGRFWDGDPEAPGDSAALGSVCSIPPKG
jgi:hypothetical protein